jgi:hypothetical protein
VPWRGPEAGVHRINHNFAILVRTESNHICFVQSRLLCVRWRHRMRNSVKKSDDFPSFSRTNYSYLPKIVCDTSTHLSKRDRLCEHTQEWIFELRHLFINQG